MPENAEVLILGGGLAGSAAAIELARAGRHVLLVEREAEPRHKVCGEFLSTEALQLLLRLGIDPQQHGAQTVHTVRLAAARTVATATLPFTAQSLSRRCLDAVLLQAAADAGVHLLRGRTAEHLHLVNRQWQAILNGGETVSAAEVILATGKHDLRGYPRPEGSQGDLVALKTYARLSPQQTAALRHSVELLLHPWGYTGLQLIEGDVANLTALVRRKHLARLGGWDGLLHELLSTNRHAASRLDGAAFLLAKPLAVGAIPYGFVRAQALAPGLFAVGDQAAVIPSFTGDGMSIALYSGLRAAQAILANRQASAHQDELCRSLRRQVVRATALSRALVRPSLRPFLTTAASVWPGTLRYAAHLTRLSSGALGRVL